MCAEIYRRTVSDIGITAKPLRAWSVSAASTYVARNTLTDGLSQQEKRDHVSQNQEDRFCEGKRRAPYVLHLVPQGQKMVINK
jgi:hypothetical protein